MTEEARLKKNLRDVFVLSSLYLLEGPETSSGSPWEEKEMQLSVPNRPIADSFFGLGAKFGPSSFFSGICCLKG